MNVAEKILEEMETPEGKAKIDEFIKKYIEEEKIKNEKINDLMSNTNYLEWLDKFTQDKKEFYDDDWIYYPELIKDSDKENVEKLYLFYRGIDRYANQNHIYPLQCKFGNFYKIRLNEIGFEIGILIGQGTVHFVRRVAQENEHEFIDFNDVMTRKKQEKIDQINASLNSLSNMISTIYENGVPIESIVYTLEKSIKELVSKEEDKVKSLTKTLGGRNEFE